MKKTHRLLSLLLAVSILAGLLVFGVQAAEAVSVSQIGSKGNLSGIPAGVNITYLSDIYNTGAKKFSYVVPGGDGKVREFALDQNFFGTRVYAFTAASDKNRFAITKGASNVDADGYRTLANGVKVHYSDIVLGRNTTIFDKGLAFQPSPNSSANHATVIFDISNLDAEYFYAVAGMTGEGNKTAYSDRKINFELYGSKDTEYSESMVFEKLAYCNSIRAYLMGEFNIPVSGYNYIKLVAVGVGSSTSNAESVWADACVYSTPSASYAITGIEWSGDEGNEVRRPAELEVQLLSGETPVDGKTATLNESNGWKAEWKKLAVGGTYSAKVNTTSPFYTFTVEGGIVKAAYIPTPKTSVSPAVTWVDNENQYSKRPAELSVQLYADGTAVEGKVLTLNAANNWTNTFADLVKFNDDRTQQIAYTVGVTAPAYYNAEVSGSTITLTCTFDPTMETTTYSAELAWAGDESHESERHTAVDLQLYADGVAVDGKTASLTAENGYKHTFEGLAKYKENSTTEIVYSVKVTTAQKFYNFSVADGVITATYIPMDTVDVPVEIVFDDTDNAMQLRPETVTAQLYADGVKVEGKALTLNAANNWTGAWTGLNKWPADRSADIVYTVKAEPAVPQYTESYAAGKLTLKCEPQSDMVVTATWNHGENTEKPESLDVSLFKNGTFESKQTLNEANGWTYTWAELPLWDDTAKAPITYSIYAVAPTDYLMTVDGGNITLTYQKSEAVKVSTIGKAFSVSGIPAAATDGKTFYLTDLYNGNNNRVVSQYVIGANNNVSASRRYKAFENFDGKLQVFYGSGPSQQAIDAANTEVEGKTYQPTDIALGAKGKIFADGLSAMASPATAPESYITYNLTGMNMNKFYGLAGITGLANDKNSGPNATNNTNYVLLTFEVWGSADGQNFVKLAYAEKVRSWLVAEFDVDITGYNYLKLVTRNTGTTNLDAAFAWADACVYTTATTPTPTPTPDPTPDPEPEPDPEPAAPYNYTASTDGTYAGIKAKDGKVTYLSEKSETDATKGKYITGYYVVPGGGSPDVRYPTLDTAFGKTTKISIGSKPTEFSHGLGVLPSHGAAASDKQNYVLLDISGIADIDRFYAVAGITGTGKNASGENFASTFKVYGSKSVTTDPNDASFELLAISTDVYKNDSGEFDVNIEGYKTLKLVALAADSNPGKANSNIQSAWANACVYKYDAAGTAPAPETPDEGGEDDGTLPGVYTSSSNGSYGWITKAKNGKVTYLSSLKATASANSSKNAATTNNVPYGEPTNKIIIGSKNTKFTYGLGVHPKSGSGVAYTTYDLTGLDVDRFYAAVGITNEKGKTGASGGVYFEVYADYEGNGNYKQLAESEIITKKMSGEFNCDITGAKGLKLVVMSATGDHASSASAWANACVYKYDANGKKPASNTSTGASNSTGTGTTDNTNLKPIAGYTASVDGEYAGVATEYGKSVVYLSDLTYLNASNTTNSAYPNGQPTTLDHPYNSLSELLTLGEMDRVFFKGLGMHPKNPKSPVNGSIESWTTYDVSELDCDRFYAAVGLSNEKGKEGASKGIIFKVYADYEGNGNFKLLSHSGCIDGRDSGEFDLDITGVKTLKLATVCASTTHTSSAAGWGNACVYSSTVIPEETTDETEPVETEAPATEATVPATEPVEVPEEKSGSFGLIFGIFFILLLLAALLILLIIKRKKNV